MSGTGSGGVLRRRLLGVGLVVVILGFLALTVAKFDKAFAPGVVVMLHTDHVGSQLQRQSDVKVRGVIVGEVREIQPVADGANLVLAIDPDKAAKIPADVTARLLPKTLFGEKYVALEVPPNAAGPAISDGDHIRQDRSKEAIETEQALNDLMPVLQTVQPQKLSATLTAVARALRGRGDQLARTLRQAGEYASALRPHLPTLVHDLSALAKVSHTYAGATPDLVHALDDLVTTSKTLAQQRSRLSELYSTMTTTSDDLNNFLQANQQNLIQVTSTSLPVLRLLARYSPEYPCFLHGMAHAIPLLNTAFGAGTSKPGLHATIEITVNRGPYQAVTDLPEWDDHRGPRCYDFKHGPNPFPQYPPDGPLKDGAATPPAARTQQDGVLPAEDGARVASGETSPQAATPAASTTGTMPTMRLPNSPAERDFIAALTAPQVGAEPSAIPGWASVLLGPLYRGSEVDLK